MAGFKLKVTPEMESLTQVCVENSKMDPSLYGKVRCKIVGCVMSTEKVCWQV